MLSQPFVEAPDALRCDRVRLEAIAPKDRSSRSAVKKIGRECEVWKEQRERAVYARLGVDQFAFSIRVELAPLPKQLIELGQATIGHESSTCGHRFDGIRIALISLSVVAEHDRAHLRDVAGVDQRGLEAQRCSDPQKQAVINPGGLDHHTQILDTAREGHLTNLAQRLRDWLRPVLDFPLS